MNRSPPPASCATVGGRVHSLSAHVPGAGGLIAVGVAASKGARPLPPRPQLGAGGLPALPRRRPDAPLELPRPAAVEGPEADRLATFRQVRDGLRGRIQAELAGGRTS